MAQMLQRDVLETAGNHFVQFYDDDITTLVANVAAFIERGLTEGDSVLVIATQRHGDAFLTALGKGRKRGDLRARRLVLLDAATTLEQFMVDGRPNWSRFDAVVGTIIRRLRRAEPRANVRAYGEMVGLLWAAGQADAAVELENFWNTLLGDEDFKLYCAYPVDGFADGFDAVQARDVVCAHSHVVSATKSSLKVTRSEDYYSGL